MIFLEKRCRFTYCIECSGPYVKQSRWGQWSHEPTSQMEIYNEGLGSPGSAIALIGTSSRAEREIGALRVPRPVDFILMLPRLCVKLDLFTPKKENSFASDIVLLIGSNVTFNPRTCHD